MNKEDLKELQEAFEGIFKSLEELKKMSEESEEVEDVTDDLIDTCQKMTSHDLVLKSYIMVAESEENGCAFGMNASRVGMANMLTTIFKNLKDNNYLNKEIIQEILDGIFTKDGKTAKDMEEKVSKALIKMHEELDKESK